ncbi:MAG: Rho termination factor N-terminal domain-containing protein, partial [bacterium]
MSEETYYDQETLEGMTINQLYDLAKDRGIKNHRKMKKHELVAEIMDFEKALRRKVAVRVASAPSETAPPKPAPLAFGAPEPPEPIKS